MGLMRAPSKRSLLGLDLTNILMADVRDGVGVYLAVYLLTIERWRPTDIGLVIAIPGVVSILAQSAIGNFLDRTLHKKLWLMLSSAIVAACCSVIILNPSFVPVAISQIAMGFVGPLFQPCVSAITLGLVGHAVLNQRVGRNESFNHLGNLVAAVIAVGIGFYGSFEGIFYFSIAQCLVMIGAVLLIRGRDIDHRLARAATLNRSRQIRNAWVDARDLLSNKQILFFIIALGIWNLANGAMLPLLGQKLGVQDPESSAYLIALCIIVAQAPMIFVAPLTAKFASRYGRRLFVLSFILLPLRALLFATNDSRVVLVTLQVLDGLGAGIYGVLSIIMMAALGRGSGRFNLLQGLTYTAMGLGGATSAILGGALLERFGFQTTFVTLAAIGASGAIFFWSSVRIPTDEETVAKDALKAGWSGS